jgi:LysM repeat protein
MEERNAGSVEEGGGTAVLIEAPPRDRPTIGSICPFLIASTGDWRLNAPTTDHRCSAFVPLTALSLDKQARLCLTAGHTSCATYAASVEARGARSRGENGEPVERVGRWGYARTAPLIEDTGGFRGTLITMIADRRTWPAIPAVLLVATLLAVGISGIRAEGQTAALTSPTPGRSAVASPAASVVETPEPTTQSVPPPSPGQTTEPSVAPSIAPTPEPSYQLYTVKSGDTLAGIAAKYHTTVSAITTLNNITDPRKLHIGQVLKIPA